MKDADMRVLLAEVYETGQQHVVDHLVARLLEVGVDRHNLIFYMR